MKADIKYWNPILETLPFEEMRKLQLKKFRRIFRWAYDRSKFHRSIYDKAGIKYCCEPCATGGQCECGCCAPVEEEPAKEKK